LGVFGLNLREFLELLKESFLGTSLSIHFLVLLFHEYDRLDQACITSFPNCADQTIFGFFEHDFFNISIKFV
jgi:hypothetical protein